MGTVADSPASERAGVVSSEMRWDLLSAGLVAAWWGDVGFLYGYVYVVCICYILYVGMYVDISIQPSTLEHSNPGILIPSLY